MREPKLKRPATDSPIPAANMTFISIHSPVTDGSGRYILHSFQGIDGLPQVDNREPHFIITTPTGGAVFKTDRYFPWSNRLEIGVIGYFDREPVTSDGVLASFNDSDGDIVELYTTGRGGTIGIRVYDPIEDIERELATFSEYTQAEPFVFGFEAELDSSGEPLYQQITVYTYPGGSSYEDRTILWDVQDGTIFGLNADSVVIGARAELPQRTANVGSWILGITGTYTG